MKIPRGLQPLVDDGLVDEVVQRLKSGKEASVYVVACGGDIESFVIAASENSPFWEENPALPVAGTFGLLLLCAGVIFATARFRLRSER